MTLQEIENSRQRPGWMDLSTASQTVCDLPESGIVLGIQVQTTKYTVGGTTGSMRVRLEITIDGTLGNFNYIFDDQLRADIHGLVTVAAAMLSFILAVLADIMRTQRRLLQEVLSLLRDNAYRPYPRTAEPEEKAP